MMPTNSPLDQLRDIHPPADIGWWPLAAPWWILIFFSTLLIASGIVLLVKQRRKNAWRREARQELQDLNQKLGSASNHELASQLNILIKRCLISIDSQSTSSSATGNDWKYTLQSVPSKTELPEELLVILSNDLYTPVCRDITEEHLRHTALWIKGIKNG